MPNPTTLEHAAHRLATVLLGGSGVLADPTGSELVFEPELALHPLRRGTAPADVWAVDGGQSLVADARCVQLVVTRAATVRFQDGASVMEDEGELLAHVLGGHDNRARALESLGLDLRPDTAVDINLLRDRWEWDAVHKAVLAAEPGAVVLVDGDLQPDWRIPSTFLAALLDEATDRGVAVVGITKHSSLSRGGAPLLGQLEREAERALGPRAMWWVPVARTRGDVAAGLRVVAARLDPDARFSFRLDLPADLDPEPVLASVAALADDAAFPGYPYPLSVADRLAACPSWLRDEVRLQLDDHFDRAGVPLDVRERAFVDRHSLMERA